MISFINVTKRIWHIIPQEYKRKALLFFLSSLLLLVLDVFSIFLLIPLIISMLNPESEFVFLSFTFILKNKIGFAVIVILFFLVKNYIAILLNKKQAETAFKLSSEYSLLLSRYYILGNYLSFKKQKKSSIIKEVIFVANDFVGNVLLSLNSILSESILLLTIIILGLFYYPFAATILVVVLGIILFSIRKYNHKSLKRINEIRSHDYDENISNLNNLLNGYLSIKSPALISQFLEKFKTSNSQLNKNYAVLHAKRVNVSKQTEILMIIMLCGLYSYVIYFPFKTMNMMLFLSLFSALLFKAIPSINKLNISFTNFNTHLYSLTILEKKINVISNVETNEKALPFTKAITLEHIGFSFEDNKPLFNNFNLTIPKGSFVAVVGKSGIGKTTLLNIIAKLIDPTSGNIVVDHVKINDSNKYNYFSLITYLTQTPFIYEGTILDNIVLTNPKYDLESIRSILNKLDILDIIEGLPKGLKTFIGSEGNTLSGGQLQRICIARALVNKPEILILDEATNNLDRLSEEKTLRYIHQFAKKHQMTTILISHDIQTTIDLYSSIVNLETYEV